MSGEYVPDGLTRNPEDVYTQVLHDAETHITIVERTEVDRPGAAALYPVVADLLGISEISEPGTPFIAKGVDLDIERNQHRPDVITVTVPVSILLVGQQAAAFEDAVAEALAVLS